MEVSARLLVLGFLFLRHHVNCQEPRASPHWAPPPEHLQPSRSPNLLRAVSPSANLHQVPTEVLPPQASGVHQSTTPDPVIPLIPHIPETQKQTQGSHISDFTNPKTGHNPFLDLIEGTSTSTSRIASIIEERQDGGSPPSAPEVPPAPPSKEIKESRWTRPRHPSIGTHPRQNTIKFPTSRTSDYPIEGSTYGRPRITTELIEGTPGNTRPRLAFDRNRGNTRYNHPPPLKEDIPVRIWTKPSNEVPWTPEPDVPPQVKHTSEGTDLITSSANNPTSVSRTTPHNTQVLHKTTPKTRIVIQSSDKNIKDTNKESIVPTVNSKQNIYMGAMITGAAVVFFAALMAICMWRQRAKTLSRRDTRFIADHDTSSQTKEVCGKSAIFLPSKSP